MPRRPGTPRSDRNRDMYAGLPGSIGLGKLHVVLQPAMGWEGGQLYEFVFGETHYGEPDNFCPPEDVGGVPGYADFLEAITDPTHEEQDQFLEWCGGSFDLAAFDLVLANQRLSEVKF